MYDCGREAGSGGLYLFPGGWREQTTGENCLQCNTTGKKEEVRTERILDRTFYAIFEENKMWWEQVWQKSDVEIWGDEENQQGIRFCIFQMFQTYHGAIPGTNIGAKGLTGEAYNGNAFWDTETYCLPFFCFMTGRRQQICCTSAMQRWRKPESGHRHWTAKERFIRLLRSVVGNVVICGSTPACSFRRPREWHMESGSMKCSEGYFLYGKIRIGDAD